MEMTSNMFKILQLLDSKTPAIASRHIEGHQASLGGMDFSTLFSVPNLYLAPERPYWPVFPVQKSFSN